MFRIIQEGLVFFKAKEALSLKLAGIPGRIMCAHSEGTPLDQC
jgi:hypothetical protein